MLQLVIGWTDTLMLGSLKSWSDVGLYNAAFPLAHVISFPLGALLLIYMPVTAGQFARGLLPEIKANFSILTKWVCSITLPVFLVLFLFPETVLTLTFGTEYEPAANALRILSVGFMLNNFLGPNGSALTAIGRARFLMWATFATAALNIGLNAALIPPLGIEGAAIASVASISSINLIRCVRLYLLTRAQPISMNLAKPTLASVALVCLVHFIVSSLMDAALWMLPLFFLLYTGAYLLATLLTRSFDREDLVLLNGIEQRLGVDLGSLKRLLGRFS
jgi:O-antigen/teichoic acid export membrane protein